MGFFRFRAPLNGVHLTTSPRLFDSGESKLKRGKLTLKLCDGTLLTLTFKLLEWPDRAHVSGTSSAWSCQKLSDESETAGETAREKDGETARETARETAENRPNNRIQFDHLPDINSRNNLETAGLLRSTVVFIVPGILFSSKLKVLMSISGRSPVCGLPLVVYVCLIDNVCTAFCTWLRQVPIIWLKRSGQELSLFIRLQQQLDYNQTTIHIGNRNVVGRRWAEKGSRRF